MKRKNFIHQNTSLITRFKKTMKEAARLLDKDPSDITRDSYTRITVDEEVEGRLSSTELHSLGGFSSAKSLFFPTAKDQNAVTASKIIRKHKKKLDDDYAKLNFFQEEFLEEVRDILGKQKLKLHKPLKVKKSSKKISRTLIAHISDTHFGSIIDGEEIRKVNSFNWEIAARRLAVFMEQVVNYKKQHRDETELVMAINGDILAGVIHNQEWAVDLITTQFAGTMSYLVQAISFAAQHFSKVRVYAKPGNHGRVMHKTDKGRAFTHKWDNFETMSFIAAKAAISHLKNVEMHLDKCPYTIFKAQGHHFFLSHGDTVFFPGSPGKAIKMKDLKAQLNALNASLDDIEKVDAVLLGHVHVPTIQKVDSGSYIIINGCLSGIDSFAQGVGIFGGHATQQIIEVTPEHAVGDVRFVSVDEGDDRKELDNIIEPFKQGL